LKDLGVYGATFSDIGQHAPIAGIQAGVQLLKDVQADVIVSVGGGSPIDAAKVMISLLQKETGGEFLKQIAIPTTLSAAEYAVSTDLFVLKLVDKIFQYVAGYKNEQGAKMGIIGEHLVPAGIILDAEVTLSTPVWLWLSTGIRALDHAVGASIKISLQVLTKMT
jgi:alcohol dehydrogenase class IV